MTDTFVTLDLTEQEFSDLSDGLTAWWLQVNDDLAKVAVAEELGEFVPDDLKDDLLRTQARMLALLNKVDTAVNDGEGAT